MSHVSQTILLWHCNIVAAAAAVMVALNIQNNNKIKTFAMEVSRIDVSKSRSKTVENILLPQTQNK